MAGEDTAAGGTTTSAADPADLEARVEQLFARRFGPALEKALAPHIAKFAAPAAAVQTETPAKPGAAGDAGDDLRKSLEALKAQLAKSEADRATERRTRHEGDAFNALRAALTKTGKAKPEGIDQAAKLLFHADKAVRVDAEGRATFHLGDNEFSSLEEGVKAWLNTPGAELFKPAPGYGGTQKPRGAGAPPRPAPAGAGAGAAVHESPLARTRRLLEAARNQR